MTYGIDFGTSNSAASYMRNGKAEIIEYEGNGVIPSLLLFEKDSKAAIGETALTRYTEAIKRWEKDSNPSNYFRFFQAIKLALKDEFFKETRIFGKVWSIEKIVGMYLSEIKERADSATKSTSTEVVLGRPVILSEDTNIEARLQNRFREACANAGFNTVSFVYEPVAAAASLVGKMEGVVLVFDFGGGTLDVTIADITGKNVTILSSVGIDLGGYTLNEEISRALIIPHFGYGSKFKTMTGTTLEVPSYITNQVASFYALPFADTQKTRSVIKDLIYEAREKNKLRGLDEFLRRNLGFDLFKKIDDAKIDLSSAEKTDIAYAVPPHVSFNEIITRATFNSIVADKVRAADELVEEALQKANLQATNIARVVRVGGSSRVPLFVRMLEEKFPGRVEEGDVFTSICSGLLPAAERGLMVR